MVMKFPDCRSDVEDGGGGGGGGGGGATTVTGNEVSTGERRRGGAKGAQFHGFITQRFQHR